MLITLTPVVSWIYSTADVKLSQCLDLMYQRQPVIWITDGFCPILSIASQTKKARKHSYMHVLYPTEQKNTAGNNDPLW